MSNHTEKVVIHYPHTLDYLIPIFFLLVLFLLGFWYCLKSRLLRRCLAWLGICPAGGHTDLNEPLLEENVVWRKVDTVDLLVKRCDQSSTYEIENRVIQGLKQRSSVQIRERSWERGLDDGQQPVIVFCVISSRIGADIESAMRGVHGNSRVILVLLHSVLSSLLRSDLSDDEELLDRTMKNRMTGIAHFAFSDREGLYSCQQNKVGFEQLTSLVSRWG